ncbi:threonine-phosphate decarboxylase CobD [Paenibacillus turpanensis]|uniref:threonine-phosphate decarboxylase CobD n=1 Tax=Paenibacillus turpanensis TaxID=2689078 RepID=UPI001409F837|nr:threonine-phosphate decarboxylase CobD [Paenibacillus turpanensis]
MLEKFGHGGDLRTAVEMFGGTEDSFLDYSSNMNPLGPPDILKEIVAERWKEIDRYPDPEARKLRQAISEAYGVPLDCILAGNGAAELIDITVRLLQPVTAAVARPSFLEYEQAALKAGAIIYDLNLKEHEQFDFTIEHLQTAERHADALLIGHPNNPTGKKLSQSIVRAIPALEKPVMVDEAFLDFSESEHEETLLREAVCNPNIFVIRSMTKFYSIPGLRLGFMVAHPERIKKLKELQPPWSVSAPAQWAGEALLGAEQFRKDTFAWLRSERAHLTDRLRELGLIVYDSDANYLLFAIAESEPFRMPELQREMGRRGVLLRDASTFNGLNARYGRTAIKSRESNGRMLSCLSDALHVLRNGGKSHE